MIRILVSILLLLLLPSFGWADSSSVPWITPGPNDKSVVFLGFVFGVVNGVLHGAGSQIMGQMFAKFNSGILVLAGFVVFYTTILGLLSSAQEGEFLGKKYSSFFVPLRTALGIILIAPTATGYSWIQVVVMWMVLQGVGAANMVWNSALTYLLNGGTIIVQNQSQRSGAANGMRASTRQLMSSVTCLELMNHAADQITLSKNSPAAVPTMSPLQTVTSSISAVTATGSVNIPMPNYSSTTDPDWQQLNGYCGTVTFDAGNAVAINQVIADLASAAPAITESCGAGCWPKSSVTPGVTPPDASYCASGSYIYNGSAKCNSTYNAACTIYGLPASSSALQNLLKNAKDSGSPIISWCNGVDWDQPNISETFNTAVMDFLGLTYNTQSVRHDADANALKDIIAQQGHSWFTAGTFYFALVAQNESAQEAENKSSFGVNFTRSSNKNALIINDLALTGNLAGTTATSALNGWLEPFFATSNNGVMNQFTQDAGQPGYGAAAQGQILPEESGHVPTVNYSITDGGGGGIMEMILNALVPGLTSMISSFASLTTAQASNANPVVLMMMFGSGMISIAVETWFDVSLIMLAISIPFASIPCLTEAQPISTFTSVITSFLNMLLLPMFVSGCMMLFYLPAVPFMIFTFGTLGWIIGVIEAMVAAPVVGFAIMSPEGNDIFGKGDPAVMILLNVFLRPSLMIFGLIAGIMISYIGVWLINDGFGSILPTIAFAGDNLASLIVGLIAIPMIYMIMAMQVINRSFTLIHVLPDKVTRWIAGGNVEQLGSEMAGAEKDAKSSAQGGMKDLGKGAQGAGDKYRSEKTKKSEGDGNDVGAK
jgi:defect-in-organelle-trafficking protein DotA